MGSNRFSMQVLLLTTGAFFLTFVVWFNMAPFAVVLRKAFDLSPAQLGALMSVNVALTIPARIFIGRLVDRHGPRVVYSALLITMSVPCMVVAFATEYWQLLVLRLVLSCVGAGFVVGIRMVAEWFPPKHVGTAQGIYAGWGNFGSAAAAFSLPLIALAFGGEDGWRWAIGLTGLVCLVYGVLYYRLVRDTPEGVTYIRPGSRSAMEVSSTRDLWSLLLLTLPTYLVLALLAWRLSNSGIIPEALAWGVYVLLAVGYLRDARAAWRVNKPRLDAGVPVNERYDFSQVAVLSIVYFVTFGGELAVVSMLPMFLTEHFGLSLVAAGMVASIFAFTNLFARPGGGWVADKFGRKASLIVLLAGLGVTYVALGMMTALAVGSLWLATGLIFIISLFVQSGEGATYAVVPLVHKPLTGQVAGMVGAYGNVGAVVWLLILQLFGPAGLFLGLGLGGLVATLCSLYLNEPKTATLVRSYQEIPAELIPQTAAAEQSD